MINKIEKIKIFEPFTNSEWFNRLVRFIKRIRKNKIMRWVSNIAFVFILITVYHYILYIFAHTVIDIPFWIWGIIPIIATVVLFFVSGAKGKAIFFTVFFGCCIGIVSTGLLIMLFLTTNYWFADSASYHREAYGMGKKYIKRTSVRTHLDYSKYNVNLIFLDNHEYFSLDDVGIYKKCDQGDTVKVTLCKGLYSIPVIKNLQIE